MGHKVDTQSRYTKSQRQSTLTINEIINEISNEITNDKNKTKS